MNRSVQNRISGWGDYAGSYIYAVGDGVNKFGQGVGNSYGFPTLPKLLVSHPIEL